MNERTAIIESGDFSFQLDQVQKWTEESGHPVAVEGLRGSSRAFFLSKLIKLKKRSVIIFTADQTQGEILQDDLKYFFHYEKIKRPLYFFPAWELLPYEQLSPLNEISGERLDILNRLRNGEPLILIVPLEAGLQKVMPRAVLEKLVFPVNCKMSLEREFLEACLSDNGFTRSPLVENKGEFSARGDIVDLFQPGSMNPIRIEFFGDEVESIREFDVLSQVSTNELDSLNILPVRELCLNEVEKKQGVEAINKFAEKNASDRLALKELLEKIEHLGVFSGMEYLAPFFNPAQESLFDYLDRDSLVVLTDEDQLQDKSEQFQNLIETEHATVIENEDIAADPEELYLMMDEFKKNVSEFKGCIALNTLKVSDEESDRSIGLEVKHIPPLVGKFEDFSAQVLKWQEEENRVVVVAPTKGQVRRIHELLHEWGLEIDVDLGRISEGFQLKSFNQIFIAEHEIFGRTHKLRHRRKPRSQPFQRGLKDLKDGDFLVHIDYGIGLYQGTRELQTGVGGGEFLEIMYADDEKLYLPMEALGLVQKYVGSTETPPPLSKMGGASWKRQKKKVREAIEEMAGDLLKLYASRELASGHSYSHNTLLMREFADAFEYEETDDQLKAIDNAYIVKDDDERERLRFEKVSDELRGQDLTTPANKQKLNDNNMTNKLVNAEHGDTMEELVKSKAIKLDDIDFAAHDTDTQDAMLEALESIASKSSSVPVIQSLQQAREDAADTGDTDRYSRSIGMLAALGTRMGLADKSVQTVVSESAQGTYGLNADGKGFGGAGASAADQSRLEREFAEALAKNPTLIVSLKRDIANGGNDSAVVKAAAQSTDKSSLRKMFETLGASKGTNQEGLQRESLMMFGRALKAHSTSINRVASTATKAQKDAASDMARLFDRRYKSQVDLS